MSLTPFLDGIAARLRPRFASEAWLTVEQDLDRLGTYGLSNVDDAIRLARDREAPDVDRARAVWCIGWTLRSRGLNTLVDILRTDNSEAVAWEAAKAISSQSEPSQKRSLSTLLQATLGQTNQPTKRAALIFALGQIGDESAVDILGTLLEQQSESDAVRSLVPEALATIRNRAAIATLMRNLDIEPVSLQLEVIWALGESAGRIAIPQLRRLVRATATGNVPSPQRRDAALAAIERILERSG